MEEAEAEPFFDWSDRFYDIVFQMDQKAYEEMDEEIKFKLGAMMYDFDRTIAGMVDNEIVKEPRDDEETMSIILDVWRMIVEKVINEGSGTQEV